jgi:hypothetical protein
MLTQFRIEQMRVSNMYLIAVKLGIITKEEYGRRMYLYRETYKLLEVCVFLLQVISYTPKKLE